MEGSRKTTLVTLLRNHVILESTKPRAERSFRTHLLNQKEAVAHFSLGIK
jgi:hypothetical protein